MHNAPKAMLSPADSKVLCFSEVKRDECLIVKGIKYNIGELLTGIPDYKLNQNTINEMKTNPKNKLF